VWIAACPLSLFCCSEQAAGFVVALVGAVACSEQAAGFIVALVGAVACVYTCKKGFTCMGLCLL